MTQTKYPSENPAQSERGRPRPRRLALSSPHPKQCPASDTATLDVRHAFDKEEEQALRALNWSHHSVRLCDPSENNSVPFLIRVHPCSSVVKLNRPGLGHSNSRQTSSSSSHQLLPLQTSTLFPVTPSVPSNSCALLASPSEKRCAISGLIFFCLSSSKSAVKSCRNNSGFTRFSHWMLYGTSRFRPGNTQPPAMYNIKIASRLNRSRRPARPEANRPPLNDEVNPYTTTLPPARSAWRERHICRP